MTRAQPAVYVGYLGDGKPNFYTVTMWPDTWRQRVRVRLILWLAGFKVSHQMGGISKEER